MFTYISLNLPSEEAFNNRLSEDHFWLSLFVNHSHLFLPSFLANRSLILMIFLLSGKVTDLKFRVKSTVSASISATHSSHQGLRGIAVQWVLANETWRKPTAGFFLLKERYMERDLLFFLWTLSYLKITLETVRPILQSTGNRPDVLRRAEQQYGRNLGLWCHL